MVLFYLLFIIIIIIVWVTLPFFGLCLGWLSSHCPWLKDRDILL